MSVHIRTTIPILLTGITGLLMVMEWALVGREIGSSATVVRDWAVVISGFMLCLGGANLATMHGKDLRRRTPQKWPYSALLLFVMFTYVVIGSIYSTSSQAYVWMFQTINFPLSQVVATFTAFILFSAAARAFQARNREATIFLVCALFVLLGNIPGIYTISPLLEAIGAWVRDVPGKGAIRGLLITAALGGIILALRTLMGRQRSYLGRA